VVGEVQLEGGDAGQGAGGGPDLGGEVRLGGKVVAEVGGLLGEPVARQLHAVAGVAGDSDDYPVKLLNLCGHAWKYASCAATVGHAGRPARDSSDPPGSMVER
jgi:hypothetical protein